MSRPSTAPAHSLSLYSIAEQRPICHHQTCTKRWASHGRKQWICLRISLGSDLRREGVRQTGRRGLPAETVLRCALLKQQRQLSYEELAFCLKPVGNPS